jgi:preprotein translocase subunit SecG
MSGFVLALVTAIHVAACIALMAAILLQSGKGGGLAGAFGAGSSQTLFGGRGAATFLSRSSTVLAVVFFLTSLTLGLSAARTRTGPGKSLIQEEARRRAAQRANTPAPAGTPGGLAPTQGAPQAPAQQTAPAPTTPAPPTAPAGGASQGGGTK